MSVMNQRPEKEVFEEVALLKSMAPSFIEKDWFVTQLIIAELVSVFVCIRKTIK